MKKERILDEKIQPVDFDRIESVSDLVNAFEKTSFQSRNIGKCALIWEQMLLDKSRALIFGPSRSSNC
jgi:deoxyhypusine synthase